MGGPEFLKSRGWAALVLQRRPLIQGWQKKDTLATSVLDALFMELAYVKGMIESIESRIDDIKFARRELPWLEPEPKSGMMLSCFLLEDYFIKYHHVWWEERRENAR